ncbi:MAG: hypothetical protein HOP33_04340 [Verrucomicrobia bacterium]|nr:hypothetical protein [Verrucomicrobiota bacterium]
MGLLKMPPQIFRLVLLTIGIVVSYFIARQLLTPASFRDYGFYRGAALEEVASRTPVFAGRKSCLECHEIIQTQLFKGEHKTIGCESCHGPSSAHVADPDSDGKKPDKRNTLACSRCHEANPSRPVTQKQINIKNHYAGQKCTECHVPHQPNEVP